VSTPAVSVLMTAYNRAPFIGASIESVLAQQFTDFELIVSDDASTDETVAIARRYAAQDARIRVEVNERNLGQFANRNRAATLARADWIKYHDSDDVMYPHCLAVLMACAAQAPHASGVVSSTWTGGPSPMTLTPAQAYAREFLGAGCFAPGPGALLLRRHAFVRTGLFPDEGTASDYLFMLRFCTTETLVTAPFDLFWYRSHEGQALQAPGVAREYARAVARAWSALAARECPLSGEALEQARRNHVWTVVRHAARDLRRGRVSVAWLRVSSAGLTLWEWLRYLRRPLRDPLAGAPTGEGGQPPVPTWVRRS
jgi:hypothetical protein